MPGFDKRPADGHGTAADENATPQWQQRSPVDPGEYMQWLAQQHAAASAAPFSNTVVPLTPELLPLNAARTLLMSQASRAKHLLERARGGEVDVASATTQLAAIAGGMLAPLDVIAKAKLEDGPAALAALERWMPDVVGALDEVVRASLAIAEKERVADVLLGGDLTRDARVDDGAGARAALTGMIGSLVNVAMPIAWTPAGSLAEADARRFAIKACPTGAREERPDVCDMSDDERAEVRDRIRWRLVEIVDDFEAACAPHKARLESIIARHAATDQLVLGILKSGISMALGPAVSAGVTAIASRAPATVPHNPYRPGWKPSAPQADIKPPKPVYTAVDFAADLAQDKMWHAVSHGRGPQEQKTISMLDQMIVDVKDGARETRWLIDRLDDNALRTVEGALALPDTAYFAAKLGPFVDAYREQIEPLGGMSARDPHAAEGGPGRINGRIESVWVTIGDRRRLAQVASDYDQGSLMAHDYRAPRSRTFIRWIDRQFAPLVGAQTLVGGESPEVPASEIRDMPLGEATTWMLGGAS